MATGTGPVLASDDDEDDDALDVLPFDDDEGEADALPFDASKFANPSLIESFPLGGCKVTGRGGKVTRPYRGQSVWLLPYTPAGVDNSFAALGAYIGRLQHGDAEDGMPEGDLAALFAAVQKGLSRVVAGWDAIDPNTGAAYPQPYNAAGVWAEVPTELMYYVLQVVRTGEAPDDRPNAPTPGRAGSGTARRTGRTTPTTTIAPRRR